MVNLIVTTRIAVAITTAHSSKALPDHLRASLPALGEEPPATISHSLLSQISKTLLHETSMLKQATPIWA